MFKRGLFIILGAILVAIGLEYFLVPNNIIDGGVIGLSIICSHLFNKPLGLFIFFLNLPFLYFAYKKFGKTFLCCTFFAVTMLSIFSYILHHIPNTATEDLILACVFGGLIVGIGVGLIIRNNGSLDGTEIVSIRLAEKYGFSVGEIVMVFNIFILGSAGFVFGWDRSMYSLLTYFIIFKMIDVVIEGLDESKSITVISEKPKEIGNCIIQKLKRSVTYIDAKGGYSGEDKQIVYCIVNRLELAKAKRIIKEIDPNSFIAIENVHEVEGRMFNKK